MLLSRMTSVTAIAAAQETAFPAYVPPCKHRSMNKANSDKEQEADQKTWLEFIGQISATDNTT